MMVVMVMNYFLYNFLDHSTSTNPAATSGCSAVPPSVLSTSSAGCSTDEFIIESLQSTPGTPLWPWEGTSFLPQRPSFHRKISSELICYLFCLCFAQWKSKLNYFLKIIQGESSLSMDEPVSPSDALLFERNGSRRGSSRNRYLSSDSNMSSPVDDSPASSAPVTPSTSRKSTMTGYVLPSQGVQNLEGNFALSPQGQLLICHCPPDAELPSFDRRNFT